MFFFIKLKKLTIFFVNCIANLYISIKYLKAIIIYLYKSSVKYVEGILIPLIIVIWLQELNYKFRIEMLLPKQL